MRGQPPRIEGEPSREPVNMQAALIMRKASWIHRPPDNDTVPREKYDAMKKEKEELQIKVMAQQNQLCSLQKKCEKMKVQLSELDDKLNQVMSEYREKVASLSGDARVKAEKNLKKAELFVRLSDI